MNARRTLLLGALCVLAVCALVYFPMLGVGGLARSEGHRVAPGWEMLESGDYLVPRMFEQVYLRKPPLVFWAIADSTALFGRNEWSARLPSAFAATFTAMIAFAFARRWFDPRLAVAAGLAQALTPLFWDTARSSEIEAIHNMFVALASLTLLDVLLFRRGPIPVFRTLLVILGVAGMLLSKGPAGLPVLGGVIASVVLTTRSPRPIFRPALWAGLILGGLAFFVYSLFVQRALNRSGEQAVLQGVDAFLFEPGSILKIALLIPTSFVYALPVSLALLFPFGPDAKKEAEGEFARSVVIARALATAWIGSVVLYTALGVGNPRYAMPAAVLLPPLVPYVIMGSRDAFVPLRAMIARWLLLFHPVVWAVVLLLGAGAYIGVFEPRVRASSGRDEGVRLSELVRDGDEIWADGMVEARPETLLYLRRAVRERGDNVRVRWIYPGERLLEAPPGTLVLVRTDEGAVERFGEMDRLEPIAEGTVHKYGYLLARVRE